jgi:hypothetical protein
MTTYEIRRWDPIIVKNNTHPYPMVYIDSSPELERLVSTNNNSFMGIVSGTGSIYDGREIVATVYPSPNVPNSYSVVLYAEWYAYPDMLGVITLKTLSEVQSEPRYPTVENELSSPIPCSTQAVLNPLWENYENERAKCVNNLSSNQLKMLFVFIFLLFFVLLIQE